MINQLRKNRAIIKEEGTEAGLLLVVGIVLLMVFLPEVRYFLSTSGAEYSHNELSALFEINYFIACNLILLLVWVSIAKLFGILEMEPA